MGGRMGERIGGRIGGRMGGRIGGRMGGRIGGRMGGRIGGRMGDVSATGSSIMCIDILHSSLADIPSDLSVAGRMNGGMKGLNIRWGIHSTRGVA